MTKQMRDESITKILNNPVVLKSTSNRPNIYYRVLSYSPPSTITNPSGKKVENWQNEAATIIKSTKDDESLIYTAFARSAGALTTSLIQLGKIATEYKGLANQSISDRKIVQDQHGNGNIKYLVATSANGVGIENSRQHRIFNLGIPKTIIEWIQYACKVGRIGQFSMATIIASPYYDQQRLLYWGNQRYSEKKVLLYEDFGIMIRYVYLPYAGLCSRKVDDE